MDTPFNAIDPKNKESLCGYLSLKQFFFEYSFTVYQSFKYSPWTCGGLRDPSTKSMQQKLFS